MAEATYGGSYCSVCKNYHDDFSHNETNKHRFNFLIWTWNKYKKALVKDREGISIVVTPVEVNIDKCRFEEYKGKCTLKIPTMQMFANQNTVEFSCKIYNTRKDSILLTSAHLLYSDKSINFQTYDPLGHLDKQKHVELRSNAEYEVRVKFSNHEFLIGSFKVPICLNFQTVDDLNSFSIVRFLNVRITDILEETKEEHSINKTWSTPVHKIIPPTQKKIYSNLFEIPLHLQDLTGVNKIDHVSLENLRTKMNIKKLHPAKYKTFFHNLLWLEEMGLTQMIRQYDREKENLKIIPGGLVELKVTGLAENRPSIINGDYIEIRVHNDDTAYQGVIKKVNDKTVEIAYLSPEFLSRFKLNPNAEVDTRFILNRLQLQRMHSGVEKANPHISTLFPDVRSVLLNVPHTRFIQDYEFINRTILNNAEQKMAVTKILNSSSQAAPYVVFGPPGTGKTVTIVEAILQLKNKTDNRILVCAPTNAACDMLAMKLMEHCTTNELIRIHSDTVNVKIINNRLLPYSNILSDGTFKKHNPKDLMQFRIVVTTLILIGRYNNTYCPNVLFVDEAAQAREPEVSIAIAMVLNDQQIVLAGDPKQLGPYCASRASHKLGLGMSLLERLMNLDLYKSGNTNFITMLKLNFRSHPLILQIPNNTFYDSKLKAISLKPLNDPVASICIFPKINDLYFNSKGIKMEIYSKAKGQPIEFCGIHAKERREGRSPSYFNDEEIQMVLKYVDALLQLNLDQQHRVQRSEIGIITPYVGQVYKIKSILERYNFKGVEVGTTEAFQGREKRIIIISTVRAQNNLLKHDRKYNLGFVKDEKRFNVALTRAMSKLIVIGSPQVLSTDSKWREFMELCQKHNSYFGAPPIYRTDEFMSEVTRRMGYMHF